MTTSSSPIRVAVIGATGYGGVELLRWLMPHPAVEVVAIASSESSAGQPLSNFYPHLSGLDLELLPPSAACANDNLDVAFFALPNGQAMHYAPDLLARGTAVIDLSADFRLTDAQTYTRFYKMEHASPHLLPQAVYGLPELYREQVRQARLIANPGCYPTSTLLALVPLLRAGLIDARGIIVDSKSGLSGAGRKALSTPYLYAEASDDVSAYGIGTHRHTPEIEQQLTGAGVGEAVITFTPHLVPMTRGIFTAAYGQLTRACATREILDLYRETYTESPFVTVLDEKSLPHTKWCYGSNKAFVTARVDERTGRVITLSTIDNLGKGMASQAVQNMNLLCGLPETLGLDRPSVYP